MAKESGIRLSAVERKKLHHILKHRTESGAALRATAVLLSGAGLSAEDVGAILGTTPREVRRCRKRWRDQGVFGLQDHQRSGRPSQADESYIRLLISTAKKD